MPAHSGNHDLPSLGSDELARLPADGGPRYNRLIFEASPYLLQHATQPVEWFPWSEEAFARARAEDKPVFLSIGYSTCHWCHVMARESFADPEVADLLRRHFVAVKVDREERPDIDATYMAACQLLTGGGGWPLTVLLTPEREPFFAGTYFPKESRTGIIGLVPLLQRLAELWADDRPRITATGRELSAALRRRDRPAAGTGPLEEGVLRGALDQYLSRFDPEHGGFGQAPKFPAPHNLSLLLRLGQRFEDGQATAMALRTLQALRLGGIYDQVGFGLHRYAVDAAWQVPHFEKMLYDQALLILAAVEAWQVSKDPFFSQMARETAHYLVRDLRHPGGGFFCGEDADSEGREGTFYLWDQAEIRQLLGQELAVVFCGSYGITGEGNFEGRNILHLEQDVAAVAQRVGVPAASLAEFLEEARQKLFAARERRPRPHRDDKILAAWNGLAIAALARAGAVLGAPELVAAAGEAARFAADHLQPAAGTLLRRWRRGQAAIPGFLEDYAFLAWGLLELHQARLTAGDLEQALALTETMVNRFDDGQGGLFDTGTDGEEILGRGRSLQDGALPSGASVVAGNLLRLGRLTGRPDLEERGRELLARNLPEIGRYPSAYAQALCALDFALGPVDEVALFPGGDGSGFEPLLQAARAGFHPRLLIAAGGPVELLPALAPPPEPGPPLARLCRDRACRPPVTTPAGLADQLAGD